MLHIGSDILVPFMIFAIPIVAIVGGITAGIVRTLGQQRLIELAQRERIAAIERGIDPSKLPPLPAPTAGPDLTGMYLSYHDYSRRRSHGLLIAGLVTLFTGIAVSVFLANLVGTEPGVWMAGLIPAAVGLALLIGAAIVHPRDGGTGPTQMPHA